jgi:hypothetical protein
MVDDFVIVGDTISRPKRGRRWLVDLVCRFTGHLLWRSENSQYRAASGGLYRTSHCRRCWRWGYLSDDHWPTAPTVNHLTAREVAEAVLKELRAGERTKLSTRV